MSEGCVCTYFLSTCPSFPLPYSLWHVGYVWLSKKREFTLPISFLLLITQTKMCMFEIWPYINISNEFLFMRNLFVWLSTAQKNGKSYFLGWISCNHAAKADQLYWIWNPKCLNYHPDLKLTTQVNLWIHKLLWTLSPNLEWLLRNRKQWNRNIMKWLRM